MPELDGLRATRRILAADDTARILILTTFDFDQYVYEALRAGASGFLLKDDPPEQLLAAIRIVAGGDALLSPAVTKRVIKQFARIRQSAPPREVDELTERELDVFRLITHGLSNALVRLSAVRREAAPELVLAGQVDVGVLGQPRAQRGRVGQRLVHDLRWGRNDRAQAQVRLGSSGSPFG